MSDKKDFALILDSDPVRREKIVSLLEACQAECVIVEDIGEIKLPRGKSESNNFVYIGDRDSGAVSELIGNLQPESASIPVALGDTPHGSTSVGAGHAATKLAAQSSSYGSKYFDQMIGMGAAMAELKKLISKVARTEVTVMINGESGTGKELCAKAIHDLSDRSDKPFVPVNCGAIPDELLESELFGHEKGAFTGALNSRKGRFEMAQGGTLFLDEIGDMPLNMQVKLLRVLQDKTYERVGGNKSMVSDVRVVTATHKDLDKLVRLGNFREDLFYRLNVFPLVVPPLRDRREDISDLLEAYLTKSNSPSEKLTFSKAAIRSLEAYDWPGNVRELVNLVDRLTVLYSGEVVNLNDLPAQYQTVADDPGLPTSGPEQVEPEAAVSESVQQQLHFPNLEDESIDIKEKIKEVEIAYLQSALEQTGWVVAKAAKKLGLQRTTLVEKMKKYGIQKKS